jgi:predicted GIY-YIG superfamily endonuclease
LDQYRHMPFFVWPPHRKPGSRDFGLDEIREAATGPAVYLIWSKAELLYVGSSGDILHRITAHRSGVIGKMRPTRVTLISKPLREARRLEASLINELGPKQNKRQYETVNGGETI